MLIMNSFHHRRVISLRDLSITAAVGPLQPLFRGQGCPCAATEYDEVSVTGKTHFCFDSFGKCVN